ncbi:MAG: hypothetical protein WC544_04690 [Patescibacteria group bacterium]
MALYASRYEEAIMGLMIYVVGRIAGMILFCMTYAYIIGSHEFASGWSVALCVLCGLVAGAGISVVHWDTWVDDYWYGTYR